jgi:hypothetical protein
MLGCKKKEESVRRLDPSEQEQAQKPEQRVPAQVATPARQQAVRAKPLPFAEFFSDTSETTMRAWCINGTVWYVGNSMHQVFEPTPNGSAPVACSGGIAFTVPK